MDESRTPGSRAAYMGSRWTRRFERVGIYGVVGLMLCTLWLLVFGFWASEKQRELDVAQSAAHVAQNIVELMREPFMLEDQALTVTTGVGVAVHAGRGTMDAHDLLRRADIQPYAAKKGGRNGYAFEVPGQHVLLGVRTESHMAW